MDKRRAQLRNSSFPAIPIQNDLLKHLSRLQPSLNGPGMTPDAEVSVQLSKMTIGVFS